jgi:phospholipase/carboxylesterase
MSSLDLHVHRWEPPAESGAPTLLLLHGTGGDENDLLPLARMVAPAAAVLSVRGNVLEQGMPRFFRRLSEGVFDLEDLHRRTAALGEFLTAAGERYRFTSSNLYALGFSNGANIAASLLLSQPAALAGGILIRAMVPFVPEHAPDLSGRAVLLSQGRNDPMIPATQSQHLADILGDAGADVELAWQSGGHALTQGDVTVARRWLAQRSGPPAVA